MFLSLCVWGVCVYKQGCVRACCVFVLDGEREREKRKRCWWTCFTLNDIIFEFFFSYSPNTEQYNDDNDGDDDVNEDDNDGDDDVYDDDNDSGNDDDIDDNDSCYLLSAIKCRASARCRYAAERECIE